MRFLGVLPSQNLQSALYNPLPPFFLDFRGYFGYTNRSGEGLQKSENERVFAEALCLAQPVCFFKRVTQLMNTRCLSAILAAILLVSSAASAAFYDGTETFDSGQVSFYSSASQLYGYVDYAVYSPGYFPWSDSFPDQFFYCYQIFNAAESSNIARFIVSPDSGVTAYSPDYFLFSADDIEPIYAGIQQNDVFYIFDSRIPANQNSSVLFFAADSGSITNSVIIAGTMTGSISFQIPATAPEPASVLFMSLAVPFLLKLRRRKS